MDLKLANILATCYNFEILSLKIKDIYKSNIRSHSKPLAIIIRVYRAMFCKKGFSPAPK